MTTNGTLLALCIAAAAAAAPAHAAQCLFKGLGADARVGGTGVLLKPFPEPMLRPDCELLRVMAGSARVVGWSSDRSRLVARVVDQGPLAPPTSGGDAAPASVPQQPGARSEALAGIVRQLALTIAGDQRLRTGSSRSTLVDYPADALPSGRVVLPAADIVIPLGPAPDPAFVRFELAVDGRVVHRQAGPATTLVVPSTALAAGRSVRWTLLYGEGRRPVEGAFTVEAPAAFEQARAAIEAEHAAEPDAATRRLAVAAALQDQGYAWDTRALVRAAMDD